MPTGYTAPIEKDPEFTFEQYVWRCVQAFILEMREAPLGSPVPTHIEKDRYAEDDLARSKTKLLELGTKTPQEVLDEGEEIFLAASLEAAAELLAQWVKWAKEDVTQAEGALSRSEEGGGCLSLWQRIKNKVCCDEP